MTKLSDHERAQNTVTLSDEQFDKLVELLTPGYEMALAYKAEMAKRAEYDASPAIKSEPADEPAPETKLAPDDVA